MQNAINELYLPNDTTNDDRPSGEYPSAPHTSEQPLLTEDQDLEITLLFDPDDEIVYNGPNPLLFTGHTDWYCNLSDDDRDAFWRMLARTVRTNSPLAANSHLLYEDDVCVARTKLNFGEHPLDVIHDLHQDERLSILNAAAIVLFSKGGVA